MGTSEAARADLYNGLAEFLGPDRAETLMTHLPRHDPSEVATKSDIAGLRSDMGDIKAELRAEMTDLKTELRAEMADLRAEFRGEMAALNVRLDHMFVTLVGGLFVIVAAMASVIFTNL